ncbi:hypothetical protein ABH926_009320 [Catenulispora sp. GP43]|uniref:hypothetical protein n=1 Tax=Catenulispora sp. GP43 TaxID=3156263 RepID=UPI003513DF32
MPAPARRPFAALLASQASSNLADGLLQSAAPLLIATLTRDPLVVSGMTVVQFLPWLIARCRPASWPTGWIGAGSSPPATGFGPPASPCSR